MQESIALASIALAATTVGALVWVMKYFAKQLTQDIKEHTRAAVQQREASLKSATASEQLEKTVRTVGKNSEQQLKFMKALNGKLAKATIQTVQEQNVEHQHVHESEKVKE